MTCRLIEAIIFCRRTVHVLCDDRSEDHLVKPLPSLGERLTDKSAWQSILYQQRVCFDFDPLKAMTLLANRLAIYGHSPRLFRIGASR
ncbi:hypothetical protein EB235_26345 [Mesorhizobium loti R88b]|uniref:Uncharacterized protein n=1 Tax=Mesorhizobium loti R88b TaxID=935548 RepID=A0A6M7WQE4_RHILI|nr:hypothetical protein EB235_26345 [Mesorhizobium loti R88b]